MAFSTYFVLNGLINGESGEHAVPSGKEMPEVQDDGWYFLIESTDVDGRGPHHSRGEACEAAIEWLNTQLWVFPTDGLPYPIPSDEDPGLDGDTATIKLVEDGKFTCVLQGSYETLEVTVTCKDHARAARVFHSALTAMEV